MPIPRSFVRFCPVFLLLLPALPAAYGLGPKGDAFVGYSRTGTDTFYANSGGLNGWQAALHIRPSRFLGIEGDVAHYGLGADSQVPRTTTYMAGPRVTVGVIGIQVFLHGLLGGEHSSNGNDISGNIYGNAFAFAVGGGADLPIAPIVKLRLVIDHLSAPSISPSSGSQVRFTAGFAVHF
jgi:hypothetical protein